MQTEIKEKISRFKQVIIAQLETVRAKLLNDYQFIRIYDWNIQFVIIVKKKAILLYNYVITQYYKLHFYITISDLHEDDIYFSRKDRTKVWKGIKSIAS